MPLNFLYAAVLVSAVAHASWNGMVKSRGDRLLMLASIRTVGLAAGIVVASLVPISGRAINRQAVFFAVATGIAIAGYSFLSGLGVRKAGSLLDYIAWLETATGVGMVSIAYYRRRSVVVAFAHTQWRSGLIAGLLSITGYAITLWAMSIVAMAPVVALRETSVVFAAVIWSVFLGEGFAFKRVAAAIAVALGVILLAVAAK